MSTEHVYGYEVLAGVDAEISAVGDQIGVILDAGSKRARRAHGKVNPHVTAAPVARWLFTDEEKKQLNAFQGRVRRLQRLQKLLQEDPDLLQIVDHTLSKQIEAAEMRAIARAKADQRRQTIISACAAVVSLIAGWLLSAISPVSTLAHLIGH